MHVRREHRRDYEESLREQNFSCLHCSLKLFSVNLVQFPYQPISILCRKCLTLTEKHFRLNGKYSSALENSTFFRETLREIKRDVDYYSFHHIYKSYYRVVSKVYLNLYVP